jgi:uncharacterized protein (DUF433 family)
MKFVDVRRDVKTQEGKLGEEPFFNGTRIRVSDIGVKYENWDTA